MPTTTDAAPFTARYGANSADETERYGVLERCSDILLWLVYAALLGVAATLIGQ